MTRSHNLGAFIKQRRAELGLSQRELAKRIGISSGYMSQIESGVRKWPQKYITAIAKELDVTEYTLAREAGMVKRMPDQPWHEPMTAALADMTRREGEEFALVMGQLSLEISLARNELEPEDIEQRRALIGEMERTYQVQLESLRTPDGGYFVGTSHSDSRLGLRIDSLPRGTDDSPEPAFLIREMIPTSKLAQTPDRLSRNKHSR